jgi:hypothetical protein
MADCSCINPAEYGHSSHCPMDQMSELQVEITRLRDLLERINMCACYASEENIEAHAAALIEIGQLARSADNGEAK